MVFKYFKEIENCQHTPSYELVASFPLSEFKNWKLKIRLVDTNQSIDLKITFWSAQGDYEEIDITLNTANPEETFDSSLFYWSSLVLITFPGVEYVPVKVFFEGET
ncbi:MAG: hypothetical protein ABIM98_07290 [candidate division WOR-3 bacterium]